MSFIFNFIFLYCRLSLLLVLTTILSQYHWHWQWFQLENNTHLRIDPTVTTNELLKAIYIQLQLNTGNASIPLGNFQPTDPSLPSDGIDTVTQNALLYTSLSLCITVLAAKLWVVSYNHQIFSVGSPYERAMKRQEAYNGVLVWNLSP